MSAPVSGQLRVITGAALWTGDAEPVTGQQLVLDGPRIRAIQPDSTPAPLDAKVIDATGCTVLPGLIDAHVHLTTNSETAHPVPNATFRAEQPQAGKALHGMRNAWKALAAGFTTLRVIGHRDAGEVELRDLIARGSLPGPRLVVAPWWISATGGHGDLFYPRSVQRTPLDVADGPYAVRTLVRVQAARGADFIKVMASGGVLSSGDKPEWPNYTIEELAAIVDEAHSFGLPVAAHAHSREGIRRSLLAGVDSIEHGTDLDDELRSLMVENGTVLVPTLLIGAEAADPSSTVPAAHRAQLADIAQRQLEQLAAAHQAGVAIALGTDASGNVCEFGRHARELELYVQAGLTPQEALLAATTNAAKLLRIDDEVGALEPGLAADLLIVRGDPLQDVSCLTDPSRLERILLGGADVTRACEGIRQLTP